MLYADLLHHIDCIDRDGVRLYPSADDAEDVITFASLDYDVHVVVPQDEEVELTEEGYIAIDEQIYVPFIERTVNLHDI